MDIISHSYSYLQFHDLQNPDNLFLVSFTNSIIIICSSTLSFTSHISDYTPIRYIIQSPKFALTLQKISPPETNPKGDLLIIINNILFYDVGVKSICPMIPTDFSAFHALKILKTFEIRSFFIEKWLLSHVLWVPKSCFFMQAWKTWPFHPGIILYVNLHILITCDKRINLIIALVNKIVYVWRNKKYVIL